MIDALLAHLLDAAGRAPSAHNTQPWRLRWGGDSLAVGVAADRLLPVGDPAGHDALHGLGALLENLLLALEQLGYDGHYEVGERLVPGAPVLVLRWSPRAAGAPDPTLCRMIPLRRTSRLPYRREPVAEPILALLRGAASAPCALHVLTDPAGILAVRRLVAEATALQLADDATARELYGWLRFSPRDPRWHRDGLNAACLAMSAVEAAAARRLLSPPVLRVLARWGLHRALLANLDQQAPPSPALCLLTVRGDEGAALRVEAGRRLQRVWLTAAAHGLVTHPLSAALDVAATRPRALEPFGLEEGERPVNLFRLGRSAPAARSPRLPADELLETSPHPGGVTPRVSPHPGSGSAAGV